MLRRIILLCLIMLMALFAVSCKKKSEDNISKISTDNESIKEETVKEDFDYGDALVTGEIAEPINLIPAMATDSASHNVTQYIYNGLVKYDKNLKMVGDLAERWEVSDDKKEITFYLKQGVKWHDGVEFTAEDVKFTYEFMISDDTPTVYDNDFRPIDRVEIIDKYTVKIYYKEVIATALNSWGIWMMPKHALTGKPARSPLQRKPIGTGPYMLESWTPGMMVTLKSFHDYFEGRPKIEKVYIKIISDQTTQFLELLNGSIDIMNMTPKQEEFDTKNPRYTNNYSTYSYLDFAYNYIGYNLKRAPFNDKRVRRALSHAVDKKSIVDGLLFGKGHIAEGPYKPDSYWYNKNVPTIEYNLEKAKDLLKEAGFSDKDGDGKLEYKGKKFSITILTNHGNDVRSKIAEIVQEGWSKIGIDVKIKILEWGSMLADINKGNFEAVILGWTTILDPDQYDIWASERCGEKQNFVCYKNKEVDELLIEGRKVFEPEKRRVYYDKLQLILAEEQPYTFLYFPYSHIALNKRFKNVEPAAAGITYNFIDWYVPKNEQKYKFTAE